VSNSPIRFDRDRLRRLLAHYQIDGRPVLNLELPAEREHIEAMINSLEVESRDSNTPASSVDPAGDRHNMYPEWHPGE